LLLTARNLVVVLAIAAIALSGLIVRDVYLPSTPTAASTLTATVQRGNVRIQVSGTGNVVPASQVGVAFKVPGTLTEVDVHVGDHITQGAVLARIDTTTLQAAVDTATANLASAQANLESAQTPASPEQLAQLNHSLNNAQTTYNDAVNQASTTANADQAAINSDQATYNNDSAAYQADQNALNSSVIYQLDRRQLATDQAQLQTDQAKYNADGCASTPVPPCTADLLAVQADQAKVNADNTKLQQDQMAIAPNYNSDAAKVSADQAKVSADQAKLTADQTAGQHSINSAQAGIVAARDAINTQSSVKPSAVAAAQASVANAQTALTTAQGNLANAVLDAPTTGVINSINGQVGESVTTATGVTSEAPGTSAPQPSSTGSTAGAASTFIVMSSDSAFVVVAPFPEPDAAKLAANQAAVFTFDALSGVAVPGHVIAVAATSTTISSVVNYYVSLALDRVDPRIKSGMTANAVVTVQARTGVVAVSNRALHRAGAGVTVIRLNASGRQESVPVAVGLVGDTTTEITGGISVGDKIVLPSLRTTTNTTRIPGGGGGGGIIGGAGRGG